MEMNTVARQPELKEVTLLALGRPAQPVTDDRATVAECPRGMMPAALLGAAGSADRAFPVADWDRYTFVKVLGSGGMGRVFKAFDPRLKRYVALKFIRQGDPEYTRRFLTEARAQARVDHPNVAEVFEAGEVEGRPYIAMQLIEGSTLKERYGEMSIQEKVEVVAQVAEGLEAAHRLGLVHRDVKPGNVMVEEDGDGRLRPYLMDFGIARELESPQLTVTGMVVGTPAYLAPEQAGGEGPVDRRADIYSLGATLYEILTGRPPFEGETSHKVLLRVVSEEPAPLRRANRELPEDLSTIVMKCLEKDPARRYTTALELAADLRRFVAGEPIAARPATFTYRVAKRARKHRQALTAAAVALAATLSLTALWLQARASAGEVALQAEVSERRVESLCSLWLETARSGGAVPAEARQTCGLAAGAERSGPAVEARSGSGFPAARAVRFLPSAPGSLKP